MIQNSIFPQYTLHMLYITIALITAKIKQHQFQLILVFSLSKKALVGFTTLSKTSDPTLWENPGVNTDQQPPWSTLDTLEQNGATIHVLTSPQTKGHISVQLGSNDQGKPNSTIHFQGVLSEMIRGGQRSVGNTIVPGSYRFINM